eukprot:PhM_4_TR8264/c0_g1_i2/m.106498/K15263/LYER; cell growth-regulating nucleolar protein
MVSFTCNSCGDVIKKPRVKNHMCVCRAESFACIDCNVNFNQHKVHDHTQCITEDQKFQGFWKENEKKKLLQKRPREETKNSPAVIRISSVHVAAAAKELAGEDKPAGCPVKLKMLARHALFRAFDDQFKDLAVASEDTIKALAAAQDIKLQ